MHHDTLSALAFSPLRLEKHVLNAIVGPENDVNIHTKLIFTEAPNMTNRWGVASSKASAQGMWTDRSDLRISANVSTDEAVKQANNVSNIQVKHVPNMYLDNTDNNNLDIGSHQHPNIRVTSYVKCGLDRAVHKQQQTEPVQTTSAGNC